MEHFDQSLERNTEFKRERRRRSKEGQHCSWIFLDLQGVIFLTSGPYHLCWFSRWSQVTSAIVHTAEPAGYCCHSWEPLSSHVVKSTLPRSTGHLLGDPASAHLVSCSTAPGDSSVNHAWPLATPQTHHLWPLPCACPFFFPSLIKILPENRGSAQKLSFWRNLLGQNKSLPQPSSFSGVQLSASHSKLWFF